MGLSLSLQDLLYISQVPTLFAVTNNMRNYFPYFATMNLTPVIFKEEKTLWLLSSLPSYHILVTALEINGLPP